MMRLTGTMLFSILCLLPLGAEGAKVIDPICPKGTTWCPGLAQCRTEGSCPIKVIPLKKKEGTVYSLEEGAILKCEDDRPLLPITVGTETHWTCGTAEKK